MRWEQLFDDLAARADHLERLAHDAEVADRRVREEATVLLADRLRAGAQPVSLLLRDGTWVRGAVATTGPGWVLLHEEGSARQVLVPAGAVLAVRGLVRHAAAPLGPVAARRTFVLAVRALAGADVPVLLRTGAWDLRGSIERVGADHLDVAVDAQESVVVPFSGVLSIAER